HSEEEIVLCAVSFFATLDECESRENGGTPEGMTEDSWERMVRSISPQRRVLILALCNELREVIGLKPLV
ncbi:hypothetical protein CMO96_01480, partial [Candidatus Woesebacteria bacterium]|nr:hypothetical protein [Candidatus Woesebacteria bacterium]